MANVVKKTAKDMGKTESVEEVKEVAVSKEEASISSDAKRIEQLEAQIELLTKMLMNQQGANQQMMAAQAARKLDDEVTVVHLIQRDSGLKTHIQLSNMTIDFRNFGEERVLPRIVFEELVGKYRSWFEDGILAPGPEAGDIARRYGIKVSSEFGINKDLLAKLPNMDLYELEKFFESVGGVHRELILEQFRRGCIKNDPKYKDIHKLEMLNRVSNGALDSVLLDITVERKKKALEEEKRQKK